MKIFTIFTKLIIKILILMIRFYQKFISPLFPPVCRFRPTCSQYFIEALQKRGLIIGTLLGIYRILRCNPLCKGGYDPVPEKKKDKKDKNNNYFS